MNSTKQTAQLEGDRQMYTDRKSAIFVGVMFILATVSAILGLLFYQPILTGPDYLLNGAGHQNQVVLGALMELILVCTAIGTAIGLFPVLRPYGERIALGYLFFRFLEAVDHYDWYRRCTVALDLEPGLCGSGRAGCCPLITLQAPCCLQYIPGPLCLARFSCWASTR